MLSKNISLFSVQHCELIGIKFDGNKNIFTYTKLLKHNEYFLLTNTYSLRRWAHCFCLKWIHCL